MCFVAFALVSKREIAANYRFPKLSLSLQTGHRTSLRHENQHLTRRQVKVEKAW